MTALPPESEGFSTKRARLAAVWGTYALKHAANVLSLGWTPDGRALFTQHHDVFSFWDAATGEETRRFAVTGRLRDVDVTPDGRALVCAVADGVRAIDVDPPHAAREVARFTGKSYAGTYSVVVSPDGSLVAASVWDGTIRVVEIATGREVASLRATGVACFAPDGRSVIARTPDEGAARMGLFDGRPREVLDPPTRRSAWWAFAPDGASVALGVAGGEGVVTVRDRTGRFVRWEARCHESGVTSLAFSGDGREIYTTAFRDEGFRVWDATTGVLLREGRPFCITSGTVHGADRVAYSPDRSRAAVLAADEELRLVDLATLREVALHAGHRCCVSGVALAPDGRSAVTSSYDRTLRVWDVATGATERIIAAPAAKEAGGLSPQLMYGDNSNAVWQYGYGDAGPGSVVVTRDGRTALAAGPGDAVRACDLASGAWREPWAGHEGGVRGVSLSRDGALAVTCGDDLTVRLWDVAAANPLRVLMTHDDAVRAAVISPAGDRVVALGDGLGRVLDVATGTTLAAIDEDGDCYGRVAAWLPDGTQALVGAWFGEWWQVTRWHPSTGEARPVTDFGHEVTALAVSPDGALGAAASGDGTVRLWDVARDEVVDTIDLAGGRDVATALAFSADGRTLLVGTRRGVVLRFTIDP